MAATVDIAVKRGINLGCGRVILPCKQPDYHWLLPDELYRAGEYEWDNVDAVQQPGVTHIIDLFDYPWRVKSRGAFAETNETIAANTFDVALAAHLVEHIPHAVKRNGLVVETYGGWYAWWNELARILKPGGVAHVLVPFGVNRGVLIDPTHTRFLIPETFSYLKRNPDAPFDNPLDYEWEALDDAMMAYTPLAIETAEREKSGYDSETLWKVAHKYQNMVNDFAISLRVMK